MWRGTSNTIYDFRFTISGSSNAKEHAIKADYSPKKNFILIICTCILLAGCAPRRAVQPGKLIPFPGTPTATCAREEILPKITDVQPDELRAGSEVTVIASGGYFRDTCGGYDESARTYRVFVDDEPLADLPCYFNHCEARFALPQDITAGAHCVGVQKGTCQVKIEVEGG